MTVPDTAEHRRLEAHRHRKANWKKWGPYLSDREWGTVREDYSADQRPWEYFPHEHARSRVYRWNEDGLLGISDRNQFFCFALALWNGHDVMLKERLFGVSGTEGNHGEDVKEYYFYIDSTPTHSYMKALYKYPQQAFPYKQLVAENMARSFDQPEYELIDTGVFAENRYFDVFIEYAKPQQGDILVRIEVCNRGPEDAPCTILPTFWFRNTWIWTQREPADALPKEQQCLMSAMSGNHGYAAIQARHSHGETYYLHAEGAPELIFTNNETNNQLLFGSPNHTPYVKDAFHRYIVNGEEKAINPAKEGTKSAVVYRSMIPSGQSKVFKLRICHDHLPEPFVCFDETIQQRKEEADEFYHSLQKPTLTDEEKAIQRQAVAGLLWSKQLYHYDMELWLSGDIGQPTPPEARKLGRNSQWQHLTNFDVISMPDKWEYPWYASWDLAFHCIPLALIDPDYAKRQLILMTREWYMHPNGQLAAYEWNFGDVNPPVHAWAAWRVYKIDGKASEKLDRPFLEAIFHKLLLNFTWWVNRKDSEGNNVFQGGFLGMDNISVFDRSSPLPTGGRIDQSDGTAWMGFYCILMMKIALELSKEDPVYQDAATKFFEHFLRIATATMNIGGQAVSLWDDRDGFFYDSLHLPNRQVVPLRVRSLVGLLPLFAVETIDQDFLDSVPVFKTRMSWFVEKRPHYTTTMSCVHTPGVGSRHLMAIVTRERLVRVLRYMLDEDEFLSPFGVRSLSKHHQQHPYLWKVNGREYSVDYEPAESRSGLFGGNSNWRGPVWLPINLLIVESLQKFHHYYGDDLKVECPTGSGHYMNLDEVATELSKRLIRLFVRDEKGRRPIYGDQELFQSDPYWRDWLMFHEYFHGDTGFGLGASHQTGWTALIAKFIQQSGDKM